MFNGGIKSPLIWHIPNKKPKTITERTAIIDLTPTIASRFGLKPDPNKPFDGLDVGQLLSDPKVKLPNRPLFFEWNRGMPLKYSNLAVIYGNYKLVAKNLDHLAQSSDMELFHLKSDPRELNNLVAKYPDTAQALKKLMDNWFDEVTQTPALLNQPIVLGNEPIRLLRLD